MFATPSRGVLHFSPVRPVTVVQDTADLIVLYMMPGTIYRYPRLPDGSAIPFFLPDTWILVDRVWHGGGALYLTKPGDWYVLIGFFNDENTAITTWYINLQMPYQRTIHGFDYLDQELDIVINQDLTEWSWKDEAAFTESQRRGRIDAAAAQQIRAVGEHIIEQLAAAQFTLPKDWQEWKPCPDWPTPPGSIACKT